MRAGAPVRWLVGLAFFIGAALGGGFPAAAGEAARLVQVALDQTSSRVPEGRFATARGKYYHPDLSDVELSVSLGELDLVPQRPRAGYFYDDLRSLNLGAQTIGSRPVYGLGDLDGDGDIDIFVPRRPSPHTALLNDGSGNFTGTPTMSGGETGAYEVMLADLDDDSDLDALILAANSGYFGGEVWINDGSAGFALAETFPTQTGGAWDAVLGDLDGDGDPDLTLCYGSGSDETITRLNDQLQFDSPGPAIPAGCRRTTLGDLDGDGDLDAVLIDLSSATLWKNDNGSFAPLGPSVASSNLVAVALGDLDGDDDLDIVLGHQRHWARVLFNDGAGGIESEVVVHTWDSSTLDLIDFDLDGDLDIGSYRSIWANDGTGTFKNTEQALPPGKYGDIVGDSAPELLAGAEGDVWLNGFQPGNWRWTYETPTGPHEDTIELTAASPGQAPVRLEWPMFVRNVIPEVVAAEDQFTDEASAAIRLGSFRDAGDDGPWQVNVDWGDGSSDTFAVSAAGDLGARTHTFAGRGRYTVLIQVTEESGATGTADSLTVHVAGDKLRLLHAGKPVVAANEGGVATTTGALLASESGTLSLEASRGSIELIEGPGGPSFFVPTGQSPSRRRRSLGDLDGDGDLDGFTGERVWLNQGDGTFEPTNQNLPGNIGVRGSRLADLDNDGDLDAFVIVPNEYSYSLRNDGSGHFTEAQDLLIYDGFNSGLALGDVNGDGFVDAVIANYLEEYPIPSVVIFNRGDGTFVSSNQTLPGCRDIALGDLDGDGDLDAFLVGYGSPVCFNDGDGYFVRCETLASSSAATAVALGDLDADGDLDAFVGYGGFFDPNTGSVTGRPHRVFLNDGAGILTVTEQQLGNSSANAVTLGDLDGDGDLDAWLDSSQAVWLNDGSGYFEDAGLDVDTGETALGDLDGNGTLDVFTDQVYLNRTPEASFVWTEPVDDGPGRFDVSLTALLGGSRGAIDTFEVSVSNLPPSATLELVSEPHCGQPLRFVVDFLGDPSPVDEQAGFTTFFHVTPPHPSAPYQTRVGPGDPPAAFAELIVPAKQSRCGPWRVFARVFDKDRGETRLELRTVVVAPPRPTATPSRRNRSRATDR